MDSLLHLGRRVLDIHQQEHYGCALHGRIGWQFVGTAIDREKCVGVMLCTPESLDSILHYLTVKYELYACLVSLTGTRGDLVGDYVGEIT